MVIVDNKSKRVEAELVSLDPTTKADNSTQRYNVAFKNPQAVQYGYVDFSDRRWGTKAIDV